MQTSTVTDYMFSWQYTDRCHLIHTVSQVVSNKSDDILLLASTAQNCYVHHKNHLTAARTMKIHTSKDLRTHVYVNWCAVTDTCRWLPTKVITYSYAKLTRSRRKRQKRRALNSGTQTNFKSVAACTGLEWRRNNEENVSVRPVCTTPYHTMWLITLST